MYLIRNTRTGLFWHNEEGWQGLEGATQFSKPAGYNLPQDGEWTPVGRGHTLLIDTTWQELYQLLQADEEEPAIELLASDHPGLVAGFLVQGIQDGKIDRDLANTIANKLIEKRQAAVRSAGLLEG
jgi:hypothetical protein